MGVKSMLFAVCWQMSCYILNKYKPVFTEGVSVVYLDFINIHILCADGDKLYLLGASHLHVSFSIILEN